jgi:hypothetical protein
MRRTVKVAVKIDGRRVNLALPVFKVLDRAGGTTHAKGRNRQPRTIWAKRLPKGRRARLLREVSWSHADKLSMRRKRAGG